LEFWVILGWVGPTGPVRRLADVRWNIAYLILLSFIFGVVRYELRLHWG
jgi:hypothetical protein